ncbi:MAG TPA: YCF48-related protein [Ignavibacteria bacterium]|nr:YCF48-related protein [Ignavibacteria bacterium]
MKKTLLYFLIMCLAYGFVGDAGNNWFILNASLPSPAASFPVIAFTSASDTNKYIIMPGGLVNDSISRRVLRLKASIGVIDEMPPLPERLMNGAGFKIGDSIYYAGGFKPGWNEIKFAQRDTIFDIVFPSKDTGYAAGDTNRIFRTTNMGLDWTNVNLPGSYKKTYNLKFINTLTGWASCTGDSNKLYKTINGGTTWTPMLSSSETFYGLDFVNDTIGFICGTANQIGKTSNQGTNWSLISFNTATWNSIDFINSSTGLVCGTDGKVGRTTNGGTNWTLFSTLGTNEALYSIKMLTPTKVIVVGDSGRILYSSNGGMDWSFQTSGITYKLRNIQSSDSLNLVACGDNGVYLWSTNGGAKWNRRKGITPNNLYSIAEPLRDTSVFTGGRNGIIYKDNNSKFNYEISNKTYKLRVAPTVGIWELRDTLPKPLAEIFNSSATTKNQFGFIAGGLSLSDSVSNNVYFFNSKINKWFLSTPINKNLSEGALVSMNDSQLVYVGGRKHDTEFSSKTFKGKITYNAGGVNDISWDSGAPYPIGGVFAHGGMAFKSAGIAVFVGGNVVVHHDNIPPFDRAFKYVFNDDTYQPLDDALLPICHTGIDGFEITFPGADINAVTPVRIFAPGGMAGNNYNLTDSIQVYKNSDISVNIKEHVSEISNYYLRQNYPNPFNPFTNFEFQIAKQETVRLSIYDLRGKRIAVLINESLKPGTYKIIFNGNNLSSGVYYYKLEAGKFNETRKMVLLK